MKKYILTILICALPTMFIVLAFLSQLNKQTNNDYYFIDNNNKLKTNYVFNNRFVPKEVYTKLGLEYFCTIKIMDSTIIINQLKKYNNFSYEIIRFKVWQELIKNDNIDTLKFSGMKIYNIEKFTMSKFLDKYPDLYLK